MMTAAQLNEAEREARVILAGLAKLDRKYRRLLGERRICTCRPCLRAWALRGLAVVALAADLYAAHLFGWI